MTATEPQKRLDRLPVAEVTFAIPAQKFAVTCAISTQETLPVVTEFSIRMIHACGTMSPEQLQVFLSGSPKGTAAVIGTLIDERLVRWDDDQLGLTPKALALFLESVDNVPRCFRIQEWSGDVYFELISLSPIKRSRGSGRSRALIDLRPADRERESRTKYWGSAHSKNTSAPSAAKNGQKSTRSLRWNPANASAYRSRSRLASASTAAPNLRRSLSDVTLEERIDFSNAISDELAKGTEKTTTACNHSWTGSRSPCQPSGSRTATRSPEILGRHACPPRKEPIRGNTEPLIGALYLPENRKTITDTIRIQREINEATGHGPTLNTPICWVAPDVSFWGRTTAARAFVREIERSTKPAPQQNPEETEEVPEKGLAVRTLLPPGRLPDQRSRIAYRTAIPGGIDLGADIMDGKAEVFWVPETFVTVLYHYHLDGPISIPIGFMSTKPEHLATARDFIVNEVIGQRTVYDLSNPTGGLGKDCTETLACFAPYER